MEEQIIENMKFSFSPDITIEESKKDGSWLRIGGTALVEGTSKNMNVYTAKNLEENQGKEFKWLFGHPDSPEEHVVGSGSLSLEDGKLFHEGKIRNTAKHPDVVEQVRDKFLGPSIHASVKRAIRKEGKYYLEGLSIDGIGLVAFQGVKSASIDYAIAESFEKELSDLKESTVDEENNNDKGDNKMSEEEKVETPVEPEVEAEKEVKAEAPSAEESISKEELQAVKEELRALRESKKVSLVESIIAINSEMKKEDLMKESDEKLDLIKAYETKLSTRKESTAVVEEDEVEEKVDEVEEQKDGSYSISEKCMTQFNTELRERIR